MSDAPDDLALYLPAYIRQHSNRSVPVVVTAENWRDLARAVRSTPVATKLDKLLILLASRSSYPGKTVPVWSDNDFPLADAANPEEFDFMLECLRATELIDLERPRPGFVDQVKVSAKGWEKLQAGTDKGIPGRCFIAMSFDESLEPVYSNAIEPALRRCGLEPRRVDKIPDNRDINEKMIAELRQAELVVADFTGQRNGVYFEAGFARGLGREVFWCCQKEELSKLHFDTRQFNFIDWSSLEDLKERLTDKIRAMGLARAKPKEE